MQKLKFRGWYDNKMTYSVIVMNDNDDETIWIDGSLSGDTRMLWRNADDGLMTFTGLLDVDGKEVYEGDILESVVDGAFFNWLVCRNAWTTTIKNIGLLPMDSSQEFVVDSSTYFINRKIIGNIHTNPELFEQE